MQLFCKPVRWSWIFSILRNISVLVERKRLQFKKGRIPACTNRLIDQISPSSDICKGLQLGNIKNVTGTQWWGSRLEWTKAEMQWKVSNTISSSLLTLSTAALSLIRSLSGLEGLSKAVCLLFCFKANQNWVHMQLSNASINQSVTDTDAPWTSSRMLPYWTQNYASQKSPLPWDTWT